MAGITIRRREEVERHRVRDILAPEKLAKLTNGEADGYTRRFFPESDEILQGFEVELGPDAEIGPHAHSAAEIILVLQGSIQLGARVATAGDAVYVAANTLYGFHAGPEGCRFFNFRADVDTSYLSREEFLEARRSRADTSPRQPTD